MAEINVEKNKKCETPVYHEAEIEYLNKADPILCKLFHKVGNLDFTTLKKPVYCSLIGAIIGQRMPYKQAKILRGRLYSALGGVDFSVQDLENLSDDKLGKDVGLSSTTIKTIRLVNKEILSENHPENYEMNSDDIYSLQIVSGIDKWTIGTTVLTSMTDMDAFPIGDSFIAKRIQRLYNMDHVPTVKEIDDMSQKWRPYRGIVAWYFWRFF